MISLLAILSEIQTVPATDSNAVDFTWVFLKMIFVLGIVSVLAVLILKYAVPRIGLSKRFQKGSYFSILGRYQLEPRRSLYLVEVGGRYFVIGSADHGINLISELSMAEALKGSSQGIGDDMGGMKDGG
ncbi:MAG: flagellar biosynthetic protein FliO [Deltaproteobacteria bacterium]|jgi:flagellar protein FliO/FliZ|nr:flagellar biosynthetic protein FliO [Deltaproteobacteria bacterium]